MKLREIREKAGLSQRQAAIGLNLSPVVYGRYENGIREPSNLTLVAMANFFGVSVDELLGREEKSPGLEESGPNVSIVDMLMNLPDDRRQVILDFLELPDEQQQRAIGYLEALKATTPT